MQIRDLIIRIRAQATALDAEAIAVQIDEGDHRSSTKDSYYQGGADALRKLAHELEMSEVPQRKNMHVKDWLKMSWPGNRK